MLAFNRLVRARRSRHIIACPGVATLIAVAISAATWAVLIAAVVLLTHRQPGAH